MNSKHWRRSLRFESAELVKRLYRTLHNRDLNTTRSRQIVAAYWQGKEYYRNALQADMSVRPLLLFYGVSSFARMLSLLLKRTDGEETLTRGHGLQCLGWSNLLTADVARSLRRVGQLEVNSCGGLFTDLVRATENRSCLHIASSAVDWSISQTITLSIQLAFNDILQRIPDARPEYELWKEEPPLSLFVHALTATHVSGLTMRTTNQSNFHSIVNAASPYMHVTTTDGQRTWTVDSNNVDTFFDDFLFLNAFVDKGFGPIPNLCVCPALPNRTVLAQIPMTFLLSYFLGMLCRYYPSHWMALVRGTVGDEIWPLMQACIRYIEEAYMQLVMEFIQTRMKKKPSSVDV